MNVLMGERYKMVTKEFVGVVRGDYGRTPAPIEQSFISKICGSDPLVLVRPADLIAPELDTLREKVAPWLEQEEDILTYALFEDVAEAFFERRKARKYGLDAPHADKINGVHTV